MAGQNPLGAEACPAFLFWFDGNGKEHRLIATIALLVLLFICMINDLRYHEVPIPLSIAGMVFAGIYALFHGSWSPVLLTIALIFAADLKTRTKRLSFSLSLAAAASFIQPASVLLCVLIVLFWILWEYDILGGADAKLLITTILVLANPLVLLPIAITGGIQGLIALIQKKGEIPFVASIFCGTFLFCLFPLI